MAPYHIGPLLGGLFGGNMTAYKSESVEGDFVSLCDDGQTALVAATVLILSSHH